MLTATLLRTALTRPRSRPRPLSLHFLRLAAAAARELDHRRTLVEHVARSVDLGHELLAHRQSRVTRLEDRDRSLVDGQAVGPDVARTAQGEADCRHLAGEVQVPRARHG